MEQVFTPLVQLLASINTISKVLSQICSRGLASNFIMFITKPPTELLKTELYVTFRSHRTEWNRLYSISVVQVIAHSTFNLCQLCMH